MAYKLLIADDEEMITQLLSDHLQKNGYIVYTANSAMEAMDKLKIGPDLIMLDVNMPSMNGLELCKNIRNQIQCPIIFLTARVSEQDKINGFLVGGDDYITKPFSLAEITARIAAHLRRETRSGAKTGIIASEELLVNLSSRSVTFAGEDIPFSKREFDIIEFLLMNAGQVFDKERIYEAVCGLDADGDSGVIKEHIRKIRKKLLAVCGKEYIETVWGVGYKWNK